MERFLVNGGKDPWVFYKKIMETIHPLHTQKSTNIVEELILEAETRKQNNEWQEQSMGFGIKKDNMPLNKNNIFNCFDRNELTRRAIRLPLSTEDLFFLLRDKHLNFFESMIQANIQKEAENIPGITFQFWPDKSCRTTGNRNWKFYID